MPFDVWTGFPLGNQAGQFGTLWDHIMAVGIWIARPIMGSAEEVMLIMAPSPARSLRSRRTSSHVGSSTASRPSPRSSSSRSCRGPSSAIVSSASRTTARPRCSSRVSPSSRRRRRRRGARGTRWELVVVDRDWAALKRPAAYAAAAAGVALGLYTCGRGSPEPSWSDSPGSSSRSRSPVTCPTGRAGTRRLRGRGVDGRRRTDADRPARHVPVRCERVLAPPDRLPARRRARCGLPRVARPPVGVARPRRCHLPAGRRRPHPASAAVVWLAIPSLWSTLTGSLLNTVGFSASAGARTIGEAQPPLQDASLADFVLGQYGLAFFLALAAVLYILARPSTVPTTRTTRSTSRPRSPWSAPSTRSPALRRHRRRRRRELAGDRTPHRGRLARRRDVPRRVRRRGAVLRRVGGVRSSGAPRSPKFASTTTSR